MRAKLAEKAFEDYFNSKIPTSLAAFGFYRDSGSIRWLVHDHTAEPRLLGLIQFIEYSLHIAFNAATNNTLSPKENVESELNDLSFKLDLWGLAFIAKGSKTGPYFRISGEVDYFDLLGVIRDCTLKLRQSCGMITSKISKSSGEEMLRVFKEGKDFYYSHRCEGFQVISLAETVQDRIIRGMYEFHEQN